MNMKATKKALITSAVSLFICFTMLIGTTFAWFTDSVTSEGNVIKSGNLDVEMYWADGGKAVPADDSADWTDASTGAIFTNDLWEPGYTEAKHIRIANEGDLALNYELRIAANGVVSALANVIDVYWFATAQQITRTSIKDDANAVRLGTLADVLGTDNNIANTVKGMLKAGEATSLTLVLKMQETAGNEYQNLSVAADFSVELIATQATYESDSFGTDYDAAAKSPALPAARVMMVKPDETLTFINADGEKITVIGENLAVNATEGIGGAADQLNLNTAYQFEPTQTFEDMKNSEYKYYIADFVVSADKDVPADSLALAGYYDAFCQYNNDNWVYLSSPDTITANTEIQLVQAMGATVHYKDICQYGNDGIGFVCGAIDLTGENAGTTITVKLCLFETTADPNGSSASSEIVDGCEPIVIGEFKYTFPTV